ncbi:hypothetical protein M9458_025295, partial [Cirrhinus mrigala]
QKGIRILNYLDDWLNLAQLEDELLSHRSFLLSHLDCLGLRVNFAKSALSPSQRISFLGAVLDTNEGSSHARTCTGHSAARGLVQNRSLSSSQGFSEDAGPHGLCVCSAPAGPASNAASSALAETENSVPCLVSQMPSCQGRPGLRSSPSSLEGPSVDGAGCTPGHCLQKEGGLDRCFQL